jgi:hypothetical protein
MNALRHKTRFGQEIVDRLCRGELTMTAADEIMRALDAGPRRLLWIALTHRSSATRAAALDILRMLVEVLEQPRAEPDLVAVEADRAVARASRRRPRLRQLRRTSCGPPPRETDPSPATQWVLAA